jgi:hypothetical protein
MPVRQADNRGSTDRNYGVIGPMTAKIYRPAKTAMQSGKAKTHLWVLEFDAETPRRIDPILGYTSSSDMNQQVRLNFESQELAEAYAKREGIEYRVIQPKEVARQVVSYTDNFKFSRNQPWTH